MKVLKQRTAAATALLVASVGVWGCGGPAVQPGGGSPSPDAVGEDASGATLPEGHPDVAPSPGPLPETAQALSGTVLEVLEGGGYTYARLSMADAGGEMWLAGPRTPLEVGQVVGVVGAMSMGTFNSPSLGRTFEDLYFVGSFRGDAPPPGATLGEALEVLASGGYTYVRARVGDEELWLAGPETEVAEGDAVLWVGGMDMGAFHSPSLNRTFEGILFVERLWVRR